MAKKDKKKESKKTYPKNAAQESRTVLYYPDSGKVKLVTTWKPPGDTKVFAETMANYMDAKLIIKEG